MPRDFGIFARLSEYRDLLIDSDVTLVSYRVWGESPTPALQDRTKASEIAPCTFWVLRLKGLILTRFFGQFSENRI
jgi:hypothetical protein